MQFNPLFCNNLQKMVKFSHEGRFFTIGRALFAVLNLIRLSVLVGSDARFFQYFEIYWETAPVNA